MPIFLLEPEVTSMRVIEQTIWAANEWLLPAQGEPVRLFFSRAPLERLEPAWAAELPEVEPLASGESESGR